VSGAVRRRAGPSSAGGWHRAGVWRIPTRVLENLEVRSGARPGRHAADPAAADPDRGVAGPAGTTPEFSAAPAMHPQPAFRPGLGFGEGAQSPSATPSSSRRARRKVSRAECSADPPKQSRSAARRTRYSAPA
jgi:hypothetical protein